jgi:hypothetical protein
MAIWQRIKQFIVQDRTSRERGELDAPADPANAGARDTGGGSDVDTMDTNSTTGTTESGEFVGRAGGDETGDVGLSGGEARSGGPIAGRTGAARDE